MDNLYFSENLCVARCGHDWELRSLLVQKNWGLVSRVTGLPDDLAQSRAFFINYVCPS